MTDMDRIKEIYDRQADRVYRTAMVFMKNSQDAEDVVQSIFLTLIEKGIVFSDPEYEKAWMLVTTRNRCKDLLKSAWRKRTDLGEEALLAAELHDGRDADPEGQNDYANVPDDAAGVSASYDGSDDASLLRSLLMKLPVEQREILLLHYYEGYTVEEVAHLTGLKESGVRSAIASAKRTLKKITEGGRYGR